MKVKKNFYYIDKDGNKKKYVGPIINNHNGTFSGYLIADKVDNCLVELKYHPAQEYVEGHNDYYTYIDAEGLERRYYGLIKTNENNKPYFSYYLTNQIDLIYNPAQETEIEYFTYYDNNKIKQVYTKNDVKYVKGSYYGTI